MVIKSIKKVKLNMRMTKDCIIDKIYLSSEEKIYLWI